MKMVLDRYTALQEGFGVTHVKPIDTCKAQGKDM